MGSQERKVVHNYLKDRPDVDTHSEGDEPFRRIVITPLRPAQLARVKRETRSRRGAAAAAPRGGRTALVRWIPGAAGRLAELLALVRDDPRAATSVRDPAEAVDVHVADSLVRVLPTA